MRIANGTMLTIARESRRLTQSTFARQIGVAQGTISKVESGALATDEAMLARYARELGYPAALLVQPHCMVELPETALEKLESVSALERRALRAQWNLLQLGARHAWWRQPHPLLPVADGDGARAAMRLRARWSMAEAPLGNLTALVEKEGFVVAACLVGTGKVDALTLRDEAGPSPSLTMIAIRQDIPGDRMRFALAVELGQMALGGAEAEESRQFAYELLLPAQPMRAILRQLTLPRLILLKRHWRCSMASLLARALQLGCIAEPEARALRRQLQESGFSLREPVDIARDEPREWRELFIATVPDRDGNDRHVGQTL